MPVVTFGKEEKKIEAASGEVLTQILRRAGVLLETPCGGMGSCGKCKVKISDENAVRLLSSVSRRTPEEIEQGIVLACQTQVFGDLHVELLQDDRRESASILSEGDERKVEIDMSVLRRIDRREYPQGLYGVTVDIGTTTLVCALIDLETGETKATVSALNPQCVYAQDVVSRIRYASEEEKGCQTLYEAVRDEINRMLEKLAAKCGISVQSIVEVVYAGNTTMLHLAVHEDPTSLGQYPYLPKIRGGMTMPAADCGLVLSKQAEIYLPPVISSYVGADITAGIVAENLSQKEGVHLFVDIGTNGEMILAADGKMTAASTAAGPAFEGMNITCGMRAEEGAVEYAAFDEKMALTIRTIAGGKPVGICGSGLFDLMGELVRTGVVRPDGRFVKKEDSTLPESVRERLCRYAGKPAFWVADDVYLTQMDIRQIQLAKSAIRSAIEAMLRLHEMEAENIDEVIIAGSFGYHLRPENLVRIGVLPEELQNKIRFAGNTSQTGGTALLLNETLRKETEQLVDAIRTLELAEYPEFEKLFVKYMRF